MSASIHPLRPTSAPEDDSRADDRARKEERKQSICRAEYTPYPRESSEQGSRVGFTLDESASGLCLSGTAPQEVGSLLCVRVMAIDGRARLDSLARVVWCQETDQPGHYRMGLSVVAEAQREMLRAARRAA